MRALWLFGFVCLPLVLAFVYRGVLSGAVSVSRIYQLAQRDTLFREYLSSVQENYDPAVYQCMAPYFKQIGELLNGHIMPLWNPDVGLGSPLVGDILMAPFWPVRMLTAGLPAEQGINLAMVINVIVTACGAYFFGYTLKLSPWSSLYLAFAMAFCPYLLFTNELVGGTVSLIPLLFAGFYLVSKPGVTRTKFQTFGTCFFAAICCALMIVSGHPEPSLYAIFYASALLVARFAFQRNILKPGVVLRSLGIGFWRVSFIGMLSFGLSAPAFLPFLEYLGNSDCYKKAIGQPGENLSFPSVVMDLFHPLYGHASPFLGIGTAFLLVYAIVSIVIQWRRSFTESKLDEDSVVGTGRCLLLVWLLALVGMLCGQSISYQGVFSILGWLLPHYCYPVFMLLTAALAAFALDAVFLNSEFKLRRRADLLIVFAFCELFSFAGKLVPWLLTFASSEAGLTAMRISSHQLVKDQIVLVSLLIGFLFVGMTVKRRRVAALFMLTIVFISLFVSEGGAATRSLCPKPRLAYSAVEPLAMLIGAGERIAPVGRHVLCPATNLAYDIRSLLPSNVYHPSRFLPFVEHCGITEEGINIFFDRRISRLVNIASVKYLVTPRPVLRSEDRFGQDADAMLIPDAAGSASVTFGDGMERSLLRRASLAYDPANREVIGTLYWQLLPAHKEIGAYQLLLEAEDGRILWMSDLNYFGSTQRAPGLPSFSGARNSASGADTGSSGAHAGSNEVACTDVCVAVPKSIAAKSKIRIGLQVYDGHSGAFLKSNGGGKHIVALASLTPSSAIQALVPVVRAVAVPETRRLKLVLEVPPSCVRVYQNLDAMPQAYFVKNWRLAETESDALELLMKEQFQPALEAVFEESGGMPKTLKAAETVTESPDGPASEPAVLERANCQVKSVSRPDINSVVVQTSSQEKAILILTDVYYPGWVALLDGHPVNLLRANYLMRAVEVPPGNHSVSFNYQPVTFLLGLSLAALTFLVGFVVTVVGFVRRAAEFKRAEEGL